MPQTMLPGLGQEAESGGGKSPETPAAAAARTIGGMAAGWEPGGHKLSFC